MEEWRFIEAIEIWHFALLWCQAWMLSIVIDFKLHKEAWGLLMQIGFSSPNFENRQIHNRFWGIAGETGHKFVVYWVLTIVGYFLTTILYFGF